MTHLLLDLRGSIVRFLVVQGKLIRGHGEAELSSFDGSALERVMVQAQTAAGGRRPDQLQLLLPTREVGIHSFRLQQMSLADARKIVQRGITAELGESPILQLTPLATEERQQTFLAEFLRRGTAVDYQAKVRAAGLRLQALTTALQANLAAIASRRAGILQAQALYDIDESGVEALFLTSDVLLHYERVSFPTVEGTEEEGEGDLESRERARRRRLFAIVNTIYGCQSTFLQAHPRQALDGAWLCGSDCALPGVAEALADALGCEVAPAGLNGLPETESDRFAALLGMAGALGEGTLANLLPEDLARRVRLPWQKIVAAGAVLAVLGLGAFGAISERRFQHLNQEVAAARKQLAGLETSLVRERSRGTAAVLSSLTAGQIDFYPQLRILADAFPPQMTLEKVRFVATGSGGNLELAAVTPDPSDLDRTRLLSRFENVCSALAGGRSNGPPKITLVTEGAERLLRMDLACSLEKTAAKGLRP